MVRNVSVKHNVTNGTDVSNRTSINDDAQSGRLSTSTGIDHVQKVREVIRPNLRLAVHEFAAERNYRLASHDFDRKTADITCCYATKFVQNLLTSEQKAAHVRICEELLR